jgi:predicted DNA-binding protein
MVAKDVTLNIRMDLEHRDRLAALAEADRRSVSALARLVLEAWMDGEELPAAKLTSEGRRLAVERELSRREGERDE